MVSSPRYISTRSEEQRVSFGTALLRGLAPDGGLYVPDTVPDIPRGLWRAADRFDDLGTGILDRWVGEELGRASTEERVRSALNFEVPVVDLGARSGTYENVYVCELFRGPTLSFKDFGARTMARFMEGVLEERDEELTVLVATSGDTGSAVADGFAGQDRIRVVLLYPKGKVSEVQERQLIVERPGVDVLAVEGTFDDCQRMVKEAFVDDDLREYGLSSANSINVGRLLPQMLYYFWAARQIGEPRPYFCVPSGNLGNLTGGVLAHLSGLEVPRFIAAHNENDFFPEYLAGRTDEFRESVRTLSNAMDVGAPSNFERLEYLLGRDGLEELVWGTSVTDPETRARMAEVYRETGYVACPHTSVGLEAARRHRAEFGSERPIVVLATAHPAKFPETVSETLDVDLTEPEALARLRDRPTAARPAPPTLEALKDHLLARRSAG